MAAQKCGTETINIDPVKTPGEATMTSDQKSNGILGIMPPELKPNAAATIHRGFPSGLAADLEPGEAAGVSTAVIGAGLDEPKSPEANAGAMSEPVQPAEAVEERPATSDDGEPRPGQEHVDGTPEELHSRALRLIHAG